MFTWFISVLLSVVGSHIDHVGPKCVFLNTDHDSPLQSSFLFMMLEMLKSTSFSLLLFSPCKNCHKGEYDSLCGLITLNYLFYKEDLLKQFPKKSTFSKKEEEKKMASNYFLENLLKLFLLNFFLRVNKTVMFFYEAV